MKVEERQQLKLLRSWWEFSAISQFLFTHFHVYSNDSFDVTLLEQIIINNNAWIEDLNIKMFRLATRNRFIARGQWLRYLSQTLAKSGLTYFNYEHQLDYWQLNLRVRILILHFLCELQLDRLDSL
jgi:hypothetical protein